MTSHWTKPANGPKAMPPATAADEKIRVRNVRKILKAATVVFSRKGFDGTRIAEIAKQAGLPKANVYYYFGSKEEIYSAVIAHVLEGWDGALEEIKPDREPLEALEGYIRAKLEHSRKNVEESKVFANEILRGGQFLTRRDRLHMRLVTRERAEIIQRWVDDGKIRPVDPNHLFIILWSATQFYADFDILAADALGTSRLKSADYAAAARAIVETVLHGLRP
jgi:AcrR family transcriptional regulator